MRKTRKILLVFVLALVFTSLFAVPAFAVTEDLTGKQVLLVDDIFTTGTTCNECAKELYRAGAQKVFVCCLSAAGKLS